MKDAIITKMIPTIHKNMVLFFVTVFFLVFFTFVALLEGFGIDRLTFGGVKIEKLYLKWENALLIKASKIDLTEYRGDDAPLTVKPLGRLPKLVRWSEGWIESVDIDTIVFKGGTASLNYTRNVPGKLELRVGNTLCIGRFILNEKFFDFSLPSCTINGGNVALRLGIDLKHQLLEADFSLILPQTPRIRLTARGDAEVLRIKADADGELSSIDPLVGFFDLDPDVVPWIVDYAQASSVSLHTFEGTFRYDRPEELLTSLRASASVTGGAYTFARGFEPIKASKIDLQFTEGRLHITPYNGTFYSLPTEQSRLWIDFTKPHATLTALIHTSRAKLNDPILNLLRYYEIDLPIKQLSGECAVDLNLTVDLNTFDTTAKGTFAPTPSQLLIGTVPISSTGGIVRLDTTRVTFENFTARYGENIAQAKVKGVYDATSEEGNISIDAYALSPLGNPKYLRLSDPAKPLRVMYKIAPRGDTVEVRESMWDIMGETLSVGGFKAPFEYAAMRMTFDRLPFQIPGKLHGTVSAQFDGTQRQTAIRLKIDDFNIHDAVLVHAPFALALTYDKNTLKLDAPDPSSWSLHRLPILISPFSAVWKEERIVFEGVETVVGDWIKAHLSGSLDTAENTGRLRLDALQPLNPSVTSFVNADESMELTAAVSEGQIRLDAPALKARFATIPQGWQISLDDISLLSRRSPILRRYHIDNGYLKLYYTGEKSQYRFNGSIRYPYALVMVDNRPLSQYRFSGSYHEGDSSIRVNDRIMINHTPERTYLRANNAGINLPELFRFLSFFGNTDAASEPGAQTAPVRIHATHTHLHLMKGRKIVADTLDATMDADGFNAALEHEAGKAVLKIRDGAFFIDGKGFNDTFMKHLFALSDFEGGKFSFEAKGMGETFDGIMRVENTVLKDYKVLNNVLAFINTVPSLATFSLPNYHSKGLPVQEGYAHFAYASGMLNVDNFTLNSPEMKILGEGKADIRARTLKGAMTLKTDLGSKLGKIPMVGYILLGDDGSVSTTVTLSGSLDDPKIETAIAKEIVTAPFNILKRTVIYPFLWMIPDQKKK